MSDGPTTDDFRAALADHWHDRPPASLEDVMALYGVLAVAASGGLYTSPSTLQPFVDDGRLVELSVDLTGSEPRLADRPIEQDVLRDGDVPKLEYAHKSSGRGAKYSLTQIGSKNGNDADGVADTIVGRVRSWTEQDSVRSLLGDGDGGEDGHPDGWVIAALGELFEKDSETLNALQADVRAALPADESIPTVVTLRLKLDATEVESVDGDDVGWFYPADVGVLGEAMRRYASANAADKNIDKGASEGHAVGVVSGEPGRVVGTPESPLGVFSVKHPDAQPSLRQTQSWRNYPVSDDVAMLFAKGQDLVEACVYRNGGMETYALPYFAGETTAEKAHALYNAITSVDPDDDSGDPPMSQVTFDLRESDDPAMRELAARELRFYTVTMPISDDKNVVAEEPAVDVYWPSQIAEALRTTIEGPVLTPEDGGFEPRPNWPLLDLDAGEDVMIARRAAYTRVVGYSFTDAVFGYRDEEGDDFRRIVDHRLLAGTRIEAKTLFAEYVRRYGDATEDGEPPSAALVAQQLVHLETLAHAGLLTGIDLRTDDHTTMTETDIDTTHIDTIREQRLERFLDRPLFDADSRRAAALAGVLVGQISWHQDAVRGVGRPLDAGTKGDQLTTNGLENALTSALEKAKVYAQDSEKSYHRDLLFPETVDRLLEETDAMPTEWEIEANELRFAYVLGHAHGRRSMPIAHDMHGANDDEESDD